FFQSPVSDVRLQVDLLPKVSTSTGQLPSSDSQTSTPTKVQQQSESNKTHVFQEHIFKKPTFCDVCNHMIVACGNKVDPVYETLRFGTSLAQKTKKSSSGSGSDSPNKNSVISPPFFPPSVLPLEDPNNSIPSSLFTYSENGTEDSGDEPKNINISSPGLLHKDTLQINTYVALYKFVPQENEDLEMRPGDKITLLEDSNEDWWKGKIDDRIGFFPANFVQRVQQDEKVFKCIRTFIGCKEQGQITLKENQICMTSEKEHNGFIKVSSGKKKGFVPLDVLENV
uniref:SH3 and cysteine rich domain n=1 Tax=Sphenodon punctatus TaxID=8508 RepID=A0A8D0GR26_SPHPU